MPTYTPPTSGEGPPQFEGAYTAPVPGTGALPFGSVPGTPTPLPAVPPTPGEGPLQFEGAYTAPAPGAGALHFGSVPGTPTPVPIAPRVTGGSSLPWGIAARATARQPIAYSGGQRSRGALRPLWGIRTLNTGSLDTGWQTGPHETGHVDVVPGGIHPLATGHLAASLPHVPRRGGDAALRWTFLTRHGARYAHETLTTDRFRTPVDLAWGVLARSALPIQQIWRGGLRRHQSVPPTIPPAYLLSWGLPGPVEPGGPEPEPPHYTPPLPGDGPLVFRCLLFTGDPGAGPLLFPAPCALRLSLGRTLIVQNIVEVRRASDDLPLPVDSLRVKLDADAWDIPGSITLVGADAETLLDPATAPVGVTATINGDSWGLLVPHTTVAQEYPTVAMTAKVNARALELASPHAPSRSYTEDNDRLAQQLMEQEVTSYGWTVDWDPSVPNWLVTAGAWSYTDLTPLAAVIRVAAAVGAVVHADRETKTLHVRPQFSVSPWDWATATPDILIPGGLPRTIERTLDQRPEYNAVFVSGEAQGVLVKVTRQGTAGDQVAPMVVDPLITHVDAARERGRNILAAAGAVSSRTLILPYVQPPTGPGLLPRGAFVEHQTSPAFRGLVTSNQINVSRQGRRLTVWQSVTLGRPGANLWANWRKLVPAAPLLAGDVIAHNADGTSTIQLGGGGTVRARGTQVTVGSRAFVRGGIVEGEAPDLPYSEVTV